jgi:recombinational DNA repair ATPase RecF
LKIGTSQVEGLAGKIENSKETRCEKTVMYIMDRQISKITEEVATLKTEVLNKMKDGMKEVCMEWRRTRIKAVFKEETETLWVKEKVKMMKTVELMKSKYRKNKPEEKATNCRGVVVCEDITDEELENERKT